MLKAIALLATSSAAYHVRPYSPVRRGAPAIAPAAAVPPPPRTCEVLQRAGLPSMVAAPQHKAEIAMPASHSASGGDNRPKKVFVLGGDGFCGWPTALHLSDAGHEVVIIDNLSRRKIDVELGAQSLTPISSPEVRVDTWNSMTGQNLRYVYMDLAGEYDKFTQLLKDEKPDTIVHFAEQRAAPYSMRNAACKRCAQQQRSGTNLHRRCILFYFSLFTARAAHALSLPTLLFSHTPLSPLPTTTTGTRSRTTSARRTTSSAASSSPVWTSTLSTSARWVFMATATREVRVGSIHPSLRQQQHRMRQHLFFPPHPFPLLLLPLHTNRRDPGGLH